MTLNATPRQIVVLVAAVLVGGGSFLGMRVAESNGTPVVADNVAATETHLALPAGSDLDLASATIPEGAAEAAADAPVTTVVQVKTTNKTLSTAPEVHNHNHDSDPVHNYVDHVTAVLGAQMLAPGQAEYGGFTKMGNTIQGQSPITALRPVIEQGIADVKKDNPRLTGAELESAIAKKLTGYNDWNDLKSSTKAKVMILSGINIEAMTQQQREDKVNHLLHSPQPFGDLPDVLTPDATVDVGYTHTLDKNWTKVANLGNGVFQIWLVSNNNNGAHTDHSLGSFKVQLSATTTNDQARAVGNNMIVNKNDNDRLLLDPAAKAILYGQTPPLDYSKPITTTTTAAPTTTTTAAPVTTTTAPATTPAPTSATTAAPSSSTTATTTASSSTSTTAKP